jgi:hypothetical protein
MERLPTKILPQRNKASEAHIAGHQRIHAILRHIARAKVEFDKTRQEIKSQVDTGLDAPPKDT